MQRFVYFVMFGTLVLSKAGRNHRTILRANNTLGEESFSLGFEHHVESVAAIDEAAVLQLSLYIFEGMETKYPNQVQGGTFNSDYTKLRNLFKQ